MSLTVPLPSEHQRRREESAWPPRARRSKRGRGGETHARHSSPLPARAGLASLPTQEAGQKRWRRPEKRAALLVLGGDWTAGRKCGEEEGEQKRGRGRGAFRGRRTLRVRPPKGKLRVCSPPSPTKCCRGEGSGLLTYLSPPDVKVY